MLKTIKNLSSLAIQAVKLRNSDDEFLEHKSARLIVQLLGQEKGIALKIAQMLGSSDAAMEEFRQLTEGENLQAIPLSEIGPVIQTRLDGKVDEYFERVEEATWVASLGQVHRCRLKIRSGDFVLKVLYPGIKEKLESQLKLLGLVGKLGSETKLKKWGFDIGDYLSNFQKALDYETDYRHELNNLKKFRAFNSDREILFPEPVEELCTDSLLVTSLMPGTSVETFVKVSDHKAKKDFAENLFLNYLRQLLGDGFVQGDTHAGNFYVHLNQPVFMDFGHFLELTEQEKLALQALLGHIIYGTEISILETFEHLGFDKKKLELIQEKLPLFLHAMFRPFFENKAFALDSWQPKKDIETILGEDKWWVRSSGNARFFQVVRSFWGIFLMLKQVGASINWQMCGKEVLAQLGIKHASSKETFSGQDAAALHTQTRSFLSEKLKVRVYRGGQLRVDLSFPARAVFQLDDLIDEETMQKLAARNIDVESIKASALAQNLAPQMLFELKDGDKTFQVELC